MTTEEQETIITQNRADDYVSIYTSNPYDLAYFRKTKGYKLVEEWTEDGEVVAAQFQLPKEQANVRKIMKRKNTMTDEQKRIAGERLRANVHGITS